MARYAFTITNAGVAHTGEVASMSWWYLDDTDPGAEPTITELDAVNAPGWYYFDATPTKRISVNIDGDPGGTAGLADSDRYIFAIIGPDDFAITEARLTKLDDAGFTAATFATDAVSADALAAAAVAEVADAVWDETLLGHVASGTFGQLMAIAAGANGWNMRLSSPVFDAEGNMTSATVKVYTDSADAIANTSPIGTFAMTSTYDGDGNVTSYLLSGA